MGLTIGDIRALGDNAAELAMARAEVERLRRAKDQMEKMLDTIADHIHYPDCWDTAAYPSLVDAVCEITMCDPEQCTKLEAK